MESIPYGPIDRLFENSLAAASPIEVPEIAAPADASGFKIKGWHFAVAVGVLGLAGFVIWKIKKESKKNQNAISDSSVSKPSFEN